DACQLTPLTGEMLSVTVLIAAAAAAAVSAAPAALVTGNADQAGNCPAGYSNVTGTDDCFKLYTLAKAYPDAEDWCMQDGGHLASIHSAEERNNLNDIIGDASPLIGIKCTTISSCSWSDGTPMDYQNFIYGQPTLEYGSCAYLFYNDDKFYSWNCATPLNTFLCRAKSLTPQDYCPPGYTPYGANCVSVKNVPQTANDAEYACQIEGGHLASIHSYDENSFLEWLLTNTTGANAHIGLRYGNNPNDFVTGSPTPSYYWTDNSYYSFNNWAVPEFPDTHFGLCGQLLGTDEFGNPGEWSNIPCTTKQPFICEKSQGVSPPYAPLECPKMQYFEDSGIVYSPGFPYVIPYGLHCEYLLAGNLGTTLLVNFPVLSIAGGKLSLYDGMSVGTPMAVLGGSDSRRMFTTTQNIMKIVYETSYLTAGEGWEAQFISQIPMPEMTTIAVPTTTPYVWPTTIRPTTAAATTCPDQHLNADVQIDSPGLPLGYPRNANCWYFVTGKKGSRLVVDFEFIDTKRGTDYVSIRDGPYTSSIEIGRVSGKTRQNTVRYVSTTNYVTLQFVSDADKGGSGWTCTVDNYQ
ncbi:hypothetical protein PFISCL1PPCAC_28199, partial [Pristionchus fissidentatus]